jgi:nitric oxide reductase subunit B
MAALGIFDTANLNGGQKLAMKYFTVSLALFGAQILFGMLAGIQYLHPDFLYGVIDFSVNRTLHLNAMVVWLLFGFMGGTYWILEDEAQHPVVALWLGNLIFWIFTSAVVVVVLVFLLIQVGPAEMKSIWLINEGREYLEAPRWADIGIVVSVLSFFFNVAATFAKGRYTGIGGVLVMDLLALFGLYLAGMFYTPNVSVDQFWWWWVIHLWVEATWEVLVGGIMAYMLMYTLGVSRKIVETWLYIEVALMFGSGILGLGHHYFWIGTPQYWLTIGGFFSALEPVPLVAMVVHAVFDSGVHKMRNSNHPALAWTISQAAGNFFGAGVWGFMHTLPQINLYTHGTQWTASHGHLAFFGAYVTAVISFFYIAAQKGRGNVYMSSGLVGAWKWKWALILLWIGMIGMTMSLLVAGYVQSQIERAIGGSSWVAYFTAQADPWFMQGMVWRELSGWVFAAGFILLVWDLLTIGKRETRPALTHDSHEAESAHS